MSGLALGLAAGADVAKGALATISSACPSGKIAIAMNYQAHPDMVVTDLYDLGTGAAKLRVQNNSSNSTRTVAARSVCVTIAP
jgi:hypothetical protein